MDRYREDLRDAARAGRPTADRTAAGSSLPAAPQRTAHLRALDHLAAGLRAACPDGAVLSWAQVAQYTLAAAQGADTAASPAGAVLQQRMVLNDDLYRAFMARKQGRAWTGFDGPTLLLAVADVIGAAHSQPPPPPGP